MKSVFRFGAAAAVIAATLVGCDWGGVSSSESWNDAYAWANFSGTYKLVTDVYVTEGEGSDSESSLNVQWDDDSYNIASRVSEGTTSWSGSVRKKGVASHGIRAVTLKIKYENDYEITINDPDGDGKLEGNDSGKALKGTVVYGTGEITLSDIPSLSRYGKFDITVTYQFSYIKTLGASSSSSSQDGVVQSPITWLNVTQKGNLLTLQDNDGRTYAGKITGASCPDADAAGYVTAGHIRFSFEATCTSNAKYKISGSLSGNWSGAQNETSGTISDRTMDASFSDGGSPIQFQAVSGSVTVVARTVTPVAGAY